MKIRRNFKKAIALEIFFLKDATLKVPNFIFDHKLLYLLPNEGLYKNHIYRRFK